MSHRCFLYLVVACVFAPGRNAVHSSHVQENTADSASWFASPPFSVDYADLPILLSSPVAEAGPVDSADLDANGDESQQPIADDKCWLVAILGNTLVERAADFGYLETEITRLHPNPDIVFRNLGWSGNTVTGSARVEFGHWGRLATPKSRSDGLRFRKDHA